jgi:[acyl-carrier-protein] S-malonyltransferase
MKLAVVFPGQGSQSVGMMAGWSEVPVVRETFEEASAALGQDLWALVEKGPEESLNQTVNTQPAMLVAGVAAYRAWRIGGGHTPEFMAGHSLGEYSALVASGALALKDAAPLVRFRAQVMQDAVAEGAGGMAAVLGLDDAGIIAACAEAAQGEVVEAVNFNAPGQVVIAGAKAAVERAIEAAKARGAKRAMMLPVSVPSHCALMKPAAEKLAAYLKDVPIHMPRMPVLHNVNVAAASSPDAIRAALVKQLHSPVRWVETVQAFAAQGVTHLLECGPGKVLVGLNKRIAAGMTPFALTDKAALASARAGIQGEGPCC